jgi:hypothetical protein
LFTGFLEKPFGKSECAPLYGLPSQEIRAKETLFAALHYKKYVIQTPSAIFQTVSEEFFSETEGS